MKGNLEPKVIERLTSEFVDSLPVSEDPYYAEAAIKFIIREFTWALYHRFPENKHEIAEQLELMGKLVEEHKE